MSYNKTTWQAGDIISSEKLNNIESGVEAASKQVTITTIINNSSESAIVWNHFDLVDGVLCIDELGTQMPIPADSTVGVITLPTINSHDEGISFTIEADGQCEVTSDQFNCSYAALQGWRCTISQLPVPDNLTITISDPPIGEERTVAIQAGNQYVGDLPESVTGRVNDVVTIEHFHTSGNVASVKAYYDQSTTDLLAPQLSFVESGTSSDTTITFRMPSMDIVSDTGYIKIFGTR